MPDANVFVYIGIWGVFWFLITRYNKWVGTRLKKPSKRIGDSRTSQRLTARRVAEGETLTSLADLTGKPALYLGVISFSVALVSAVARLV